MACGWGCKRLENGLGFRLETECNCNLAQLEFRLALACARVCKRHATASNLTCGWGCKRLAKGLGPRLETACNLAQLEFRLALACTRVCKRHGTASNLACGCDCKQPATACCSTRLSLAGSKQLQPSSARARAYTGLYSRLQATCDSGNFGLRLRLQTACYSMLQH